MDGAPVNLPAHAGHSERSVLQLRRLKRELWRNQRELFMKRLKLYLSPQSVPLIETTFIQIP